MSDLRALRSASLEVGVATGFVSCFPRLVRTRDVPGVAVADTAGRRMSLVDLVETAVASLVELVETAVASLVELVETPVAPLVELVETPVADS